MSSKQCFYAPGQGFPISYGPNSTDGWRFMPCGSSNDSNAHFSCCGWGDTCYNDSLCSYSHSQAGGSGWYAAFCNDEEFTDESCISRCDGPIFPEAIWDPKISRWACCGEDQSGVKTCWNHTNQLFNAPAPQDLRAYYIIGHGPIDNGSAQARASSTTSSSLTESATHTGLSASRTSSPDSDPGPHSGLSSGARAGIGWGIAAGALVTALLLYGIIFRRRRRRRRHREQKEPSDFVPPLELPALQAWLGSSMYVKPELPGDGHQASLLSRSNSAPAGFARMFGDRSDGKKAVLVEANAGLEPHEME